MVKKFYDNAIVGERIKQLLSENEQTHQDLADMISVNVRSVDYWCSSRRIPSDRYQEEICKVYKVNREWLTGRSDYKNDYYRFVAEGKVKAWDQYWKDNKTMEKVQLIELIELIGEFKFDFLPYEGEEYFDALVNSVISNAKKRYEQITGRVVNPSVEIRRTKKSTKEKRNDEKD